MVVQTRVLGLGRGGGCVCGDVWDGVMFGPGTWIALSPLFTASLKRSAKALNLRGGRRRGRKEREEGGEGGRRRGRKEERAEKVMHVDGVPYTVRDALTVLPSTLNAHTPAVATPAPQRNDQHVVETDQWHAAVHQPRNTADISENDAQKQKIK